MKTPKLSQRSADGSRYSRFSRLGIAAAALLALVLGCRQEQPADGGSTAADSAPSMTDDPAATAGAMLALAEHGEWGAYVDTYYGESHKFGSVDDQNTLVERFEQTWGAQVVEALRQAVTITPVIDDNGRAVFSKDNQLVFVLYRGEDGRWTFHL